MDAAGTKGRKFPAYTTTELKARIAAGTASQAVKDEVIAREHGLSVVYEVPQIVPTAENLSATPTEPLDSVRAQWKARNDEAERLNRAGVLQCLGNYTPIGSVYAWQDSGRKWRVVERLGTHDGPYYSGTYAHWFRCEEITDDATMLDRVCTRLWDDFMTDPCPTARKLKYKAYELACFARGDFAGTDYTPAEPLYKPTAWDALLTHPSEAANRVIACLECYGAGRDKCVHGCI